MSAPLTDPSYGLSALLANSVGGRVVPTPLTSLNAVTTGTGAVLDCGSVFSNPWMLLSAPATPGAGAVTFEGSMDGNTWYAIHAATTVPDTTTVITVGPNVPARYLRARVSTTVTTTTATAVIGAI